MYTLTVKLEQGEHLKHYIKGYQDNHFHTPLL